MIESGCRASDIGSSQWNKGEETQASTGLGPVGESRPRTIAIPTAVGTGPHEDDLVVLGPHKDDLVSLGPDIGIGYNI